MLFFPLNLNKRKEKISKIRFLLPTGKVHKNYNKFILWNGFSLFISSIESVLATSSMLEAVSTVPEKIHENLEIPSDVKLNIIETIIKETNTETLCDNTDNRKINIISEICNTCNTAEQNNTVSNISINYIGKDVLGQIGSLLIINKVGKYIDRDPKKFLSICMLIQQTSVFIECSTPLFPLEYFICVAALSNVGKCIAFTGFGGVNVKAINKLAVDGDNTGEIYSKLTMINTVTTSIGMGCGLLLTTYIPDHYTRLKLLPFLGFLRYYSMKMSLKGIL